MDHKKSRGVVLKSRPSGLPTPADFELVETPVPEPGPGEALVRNILLSVDPYMRGRMTDRSGYADSFRLGELLEGGAIGQVVESTVGELKRGDYVLGMKGFREFFVCRPDEIRTIDPKLAPIETYLGVMGMPGKTAYVGMFEMAEVEAGQTVWVSAAAGAVGSAACQLGKLMGCRVVGSAGSDAKTEWLLKEAGIDAAFNYKGTKNLARELSRHFPDGIDVYFDNVGGVHLEAALETMKPNGRIVLCGMISQYNARVPAGPRNLFHAILKRLTIRGFIVSDHAERTDEFTRDMAQWILEGKVRWADTIVTGIEKAPEAFIGLFSGENLGKMLVRVGPDAET